MYAMDITVIIMDIVNSIKQEMDISSEPVTLINWEKWDNIKPTISQITDKK